MIDYPLDYLISGDTYIKAVNVDTKSRVVGYMRLLHFECALNPNQQTFKTIFTSLPLQMVTAVEESGCEVSLSELVTGVTTRQCCWWVSPHNTPNTLWGWGGIPLQHTPVSLSA